MYIHMHVFSYDVIYVTENIQTSVKKTIKLPLSFGSSFSKAYSKLEPHQGLTQ